MKYTNSFFIKEKCMEKGKLIIANVFIKVYGKVQTNNSQCYLHFTAMRIGYSSTYVYER